VKGIIRGAIIGGVIASIILFAKGSSWSINAVIIPIWATLGGVIGYFEARYSPPREKNKQPDAIQPEKIQFSIARLLLATAMVALVFGVMRYLFDYKASPAIIVTSIIAFALGGIILLGKKRDFKEIAIVISIFTILGIMFVINIWIAYYTANR